MRINLGLEILNTKVAHWACAWQTFPLCQNNTSKFWDFSIVLSRGGAGVHISLELQQRVRIPSQRRFPSGFLVVFRHALGDQGTWSQGFLNGFARMRQSHLILGATVLLGGLLCVWLLSSNRPRHDAQRRWWFPVSTLPVQQVLSTAGLADSCITWYFYNDTPHDDRFGISTRPINLLRPGKDVIALPSGCAKLTTFWGWLAERYSYEPWQALWYAPADEADPVRVHRDVVAAAGRYTAGPAAARCARMTLIPRRGTHPLAALATGNGLLFLGDDDHGALPKKDCLHPFLDKGRESLVHRFLLNPYTGEPARIRVPRGFRCRTKRELLDAYRLLTDQGFTLFLKPGWQEGGFGIEYNVSYEAVRDFEWDTAQGPVVLEEALGRDAHPDGRPILPVALLLASSIVGDVVEQLVRKASGYKAYFGTLSPIQVPPDLKQRLRDCALQVADVLQFKGFWGVDFLLHDGEIYLIDINSGRLNGGHPPILFASMYAPGQPFQFWRNAQLIPDAEAIEAMLQRLGLAFTSRNKRGVVIMSSVPGIESSFLAIGKSIADLESIIALWNAHVPPVLQVG